MHSCIFEGTISHCRFEPIEHRFHYRNVMLFLDLNEIPEIVGPGKMLSDRRRSLRAFLPEDHLNGIDPLDQQVRQAVHEQTGCYPKGPIRLLTQLRHWGYYFSPLNLFYVYKAGGDAGVESIVAEVNNTPWGERHLYVLWQGNCIDEGKLHFQHAKQMHVSPFMDMDMDYRWRLSQPSDRLTVCVENYREDKRLFAAALNLQRRELSRSTLNWMSLRYPLMTLQIITAIHYQALKLWWKKCPVYLHPNKRPTLSKASQLAQQPPSPPI